MSPSTPKHLMSELIRMTSVHNIAPEPILAQVGIDLSGAHKDFAGIDRDHVARYLYNLCIAIEDESAGFGAEPIPMGTCYMMSRLTVNQSTLREALDVGYGFYHMVTEAFRGEVSEDSGVAFIELKLMPAPPERDPHHVFAELMLMSSHLHSCFLIGQVIPLIDVHFNYEAPADTAFYSALFPGNHVFNSDKLGFSFPASFLDREVVQDDRSVKEFINKSPRGVIKLCDAELSMTGRIKRYLRPLVRSGLPSIDTAAETLNLTKRTLNRKLKEEHTTYQELKDIVRRDEAIDLLVENKLPVKKISELILFSEPSVFSRAFTSWTGQSPGKFRENLNKKNRPFETPTEVPPAPHPPCDRMP